MQEHLDRSGTYVAQPDGHKAFVPAPLPPEPALDVDAEMHALLSKADRALGRLDGSIQTLPASDLFVFMYVRKEAVLSSQIEGTQSSLSDVLEAEAKIMSPGRPGDVPEVLNYIDAMNYGLNRLETLPVSLRLIREIHQHLLANVRGSQRQPGEFRQIQNWIGPSGSSIANASFVPPPPNLLKGTLDDWEVFLHKEHHLPLLIHIGMAHAQFETIHPFLDGNGRVGRLLITFLLCEKQVLQKPVLYLSHYFKVNRSKYYDSLQAIRDMGDWEGWIKFFLQGVAEVANEAVETSRKIVQLREEHRDLIIAAFGRSAGNALKILERLYTYPIASVRHMSEWAGVSLTAANTLAEKFVEQGILKEITGHSRNRRYRYDDYVGLFAD